MKKYSFFIILASIVSCKNASNNIDLSVPQTTFEEPVIQPLKFSKAKKINWTGIKTVKIQPVVTQLTWNKLPEHPYDTAGFKPFKYRVQETHFDYNSLPEKDLDIDNLPSHTLKFKTFILPQPKLIKGAKLQLTNENLFVMGFGDEPGKKKLDIRYLFQDRDGFLWIASTEGLYRFDGENLFLILTYPTTRYNLGMVQDDQGNIWISDFYNGITVLNPNNGTLKRSGLGQGLGSVRITRLMLDRQHKIWATSWSNGIDIIDPKTQTVQTLDKSYRLSPSDSSFSSTMDKSGNIWISGHGKGVSIIDIKNKKIKYFDKVNGLKAGADRAIFCDTAGRIWIGLRGGQVAIVDLEKKAVQTISEAKSGNPSAKDGSGFLQDSKGRVWISSFNGGIAIVNIDKHLVMHLGENNGLISNEITDIKRDNEGHLWIATVEGLNMTNNKKAVIEWLGSDNVNALTEDQQGFIWKTTPNGVDIINRKRSTSKHLSVQQGLADDNTRNVYAINGRIFITTNTGLDIVDVAKKTITYLGGKQGLSGYDINGIAADKAGRIWIGQNNGGIDLYDPENKTVKNLGKAQGLPDDTDGVLCQGQEGNIWVSLLSGGICKIDPYKSTIQYLNNVPDLKSADFKMLLPDNKGNIWIGSDHGLYIADLKNQKLLSFAASQGLIDNKVLSILKHNDTIYAGTNPGVTMITPPVEGVSINKKWRVVSYGLSKTNLDNYGVDFISADGIYWSSGTGITLLDFSKKETFKSTAYIAGISIYGRPMYFIDQSGFNPTFKDTLWDLNEKNYYLKSSIAMHKNNAWKRRLTWDSVSGPGNMPTNLQLPHDQNFIQFHYSSFNFTPHDTATFRYILIGADEKWSPTTSEFSTINYMNLQPGSYTFEVISKDANNIWSQPARLSFIINPAWWQTWWAYILYMCLFVATVWCFVYLRSLQLLNEKRKLEHQVQIRTEEVLQQKEEIEAQRDKLEMEKVRSNIAADFHDELGSTLSTIALYSEMAITGNFEDKERTKNILSLISESSRGTVSAMQDMIWTIQPKNDKMQEVVYRMREYAYPLAELKNISLTFDIGDDVQALILSMDMRKNIYLIFKEALNNAFKYAAATAITLRMTKQNNLLSLEIKDNGKGFDPANLKAGNGLTNMQKRAGQSGGTLSIKSGKGMGTEIFFMIPVS